MIRHKILGLTLCLIAAPAFAADAEQWQCQYDGHWSTTNSSDKGDFNWDVLWKGTASGWEVTGDYDDRYGKSVLDGTCNKHACQFKQLYRSGELKGKKYYWTGEYTDKVDGKTSVNTFKGTWGYTSGATDGGKWNAVATCVQK